MLKAYFKPQNNIMGSDQPFRFSLLNSTGSATSCATNRFLQQQQIAAIKNNYSYQSAMCLNQDSIQELQWWFNNLEIYNGKLIVSPTPKSVIQSDASKKGWGAYCQKVSTGGQWSLQESKLRINVLELLTIKLALLTFSKMFNLSLVHFQVDNMSAFSYLMKMGGGGGPPNKEMIAISKEF